MFGVTGTNGKTTTVHVLDAVLRRLGRRTAHSSTVDRRIGSTTAASALTTPEAPELHAFLAAAAEARVEGVALEVSAQALTRHRADGVVVDVAGFTNLSHDHLDDYADMDAYLAAKAELFTPAHARAGVVSLDSPAGHRIVAAARVPVTTVTVRPDVAADWSVRVTEQRADGTRAELTAPDGAVLAFTVALLGTHAAADTGLALAMLAVSGVPFAALRAATASPLDVVVPGRMADASAPTGPRVWVDFAHTPDAFAKSLEAVRAVVPGTVAIVLGADGDRDPSKRHAMGVVAATAADVVVVADHHPRTEAPDPIGRPSSPGRGPSAREPWSSRNPTRRVRSAWRSRRSATTVPCTGPDRVSPTTGTWTACTCRTRRSTTRNARWPRRGTPGGRASSPPPEKDCAQPSCVQHLRHAGDRRDGVLLAVRGVPGHHPAYRALLEPWGLTYPQYLVLVTLWIEGDQTVSTLGDHLQLDSGTLSPLLRRMEQTDLVRRERRSTDERVVTVALGDRGRSIRPELAHVPARIAAGWACPTSRPHSNSSRRSSA